MARYWPVGNLDQVSAVTLSYCRNMSYWWAILDNLRNFFLSPSAEMLSFFQQLRRVL